MEMPENKVREIMKIAKEPISMETPMGEDGDSQLGDFIEDNTTLAPLDAALHASMRNVIKEVLDSLTPREAKVLRMRYGVEMSNDHTLEEVGKQFDVTRERIRQIEAKAMSKLRQPSRSDKLKTFLHDTKSSSCPALPDPTPRARKGRGVFYLARPNRLLLFHQDKRLPRYCNFFTETSKVLEPLPCTRGYWGNSNHPDRTRWHAAPLFLAPLSLVFAALCLPFAGAHAADDDSISTDRPDFVESSQVVGKGRVQLETSVQWDRLRNDTTHERTFSTPTLLRIGLGDTTELRIETDGRSVTHSTDLASGAREVTPAMPTPRSASSGTWPTSRVKASARPRWASCCTPTCRAAAANCAATACAPRCAWRPSGTWPAAIPSA
jgi:DNA-binding CsgD family transcriptional regulator